MESFFSRVLRRKRAVADAAVVLPTPPLPPKNKYRFTAFSVLCVSVVCLSRKSVNHTDTEAQRKRLTFAEAAGVVATDLDHKARRVSRGALCSSFMQQVELPRLDHAQAREQLSLAFLELLVRDLFQLVTHLQLEQLVLDHRVVIELLIGHLLNLAQDELEAVNRRHQ